MLLGNFIIAFQVLIKKVNISHYCDNPRKKKNNWVQFESSIKILLSTQHWVVGEDQKEGILKITEGLRKP